MANIGMSRKEVIQVISDIGQTNFHFQAENHLDYLIWEKESDKSEEAWAGD